VVLTDVNEATGPEVANRINARFARRDFTDETGWVTLLKSRQLMSELHAATREAHIRLPTQWESEDYTKSLMFQNHKVIGGNAI
jgi:hypothetical protein